MTGKSGGVQWEGAYTAGAIEGQCGPGGTFQLRRVERKSPTLGKKPPQGAIVLLDGKDFSEMRLANGAELDPSKLHPCKEDGSIQVPGGGMNSKRAFPGNLDLHVEFLIPFMPSAHGQGARQQRRLLPNRDEIQVLDSFGEVTYLGGGCGGTYAYKDPDTMEVVDSLKSSGQCKFSLASLPPLAWQTYDIEYRVEMKDGKPAGKPHVTVCHNGIEDSRPRRTAQSGRRPRVAHRQASLPGPWQPGPLPQHLGRAAAVVRHERLRRRRGITSTCRERPPWRSGSTGDAIRQAAERHGGRSLQNDQNREVIFRPILTARRRLWFARVAKPAESAYDMK